MKITLPLILALLLVYNIPTAMAQQANIPHDTVFYQGTQHMNMLILTKDYHQLTQNDRLSVVLADFQSRMKKIETQLPEKPYSITYNYQQKLDILQRDSFKSYSVSAENGLMENFRNEATITHSNFRVIIGFNEIVELNQTDLVAVVAEITSELPEKDRYLRYLGFQPDSQNGKATLISNRPSGYLDMLSLMAGVGASVYRNQFLTDFTGEISLQLNKKGILKNQYYVSNNLIFAFDEANAPIINNFTNIGYRRNLSKEKDNPNWLGVEFGLLTSRRGDIFQPNTMRLGMNWQAAKHITVSPQLHFTGLFKQVSPGFRVGIGF